MSTKTIIYLIRHGQTDSNVLHYWAGQGIDPLNPTGHLQAQRVAERLAKKSLDVLYSSDSIRTMQTAQHIAEVTGLEIYPDPRLREIDTGHYQGFHTAQIKAVDSERLAAFREDPFNVRIPGGEHLNDQADRVEAAFKDITAAHPGARVCIVTHGGAIASLIYVLNDRDEQARHVDLYNTSITTLRGENGTWEVMKVNDHAHLEP